MTEILSRLASVYGPDTQVPVTPVRIQDSIERADRVTPDALYSQMPPEIHDKFISRKGNPKERKLKRFLRQLDNLLGLYSPTELMQIKPDCIENDGRIKKKTLNRYLYKHGS